MLLAVALVAQELGIHTLQRLLEALLGLLDACRCRAEGKGSASRSRATHLEAMARGDGKCVRARHGKTLRPRKADARDDAAGWAGNASHAARRREAIECAMSFQKTSHQIRGRSRRERRRHRAVIGRSRLKCSSPRVSRDGVKTRASPGSTPRGAPGWGRHAPLRWFLYDWLCAVWFVDLAILPGSR